MFNILPEIHQTLCYIVHDKSKANPERDLMDLTTSVTDHIFASFQGGNNKKGRKYTKSVQMKTIVNLDFPEINVTFLKISRAK